MTVYCLLFHWSNLQKSQKGIWTMELYSTPHGRKRKVFSASSFAFPLLFYPCSHPWLTLSSFWAPLILLVFFRINVATNFLVLFPFFLLFSHFFPNSWKSLSLLVNLLLTEYSIAAELRRRMKLFHTSGFMPSFFFLNYLEIF